VVVAASDRRRSEAAHIGACEVKFDTPNHCLGVLLLQASAGALKAGCGAFVAGKKAFFLNLTKHLNLRELSSSGKRMVALTAAGVCALPHPECGKNIIHWWSRISALDIAQTDSGKITIV
jgi:hypothetical protein